jgi:hypothetical protein
MTSEQLTNFLDRPDVRVKVDGLTVIVCDKQRRWEGTGATVAEAAEIAIEEERKYRTGFPAMVAKDLGVIVAHAGVEIQDDVVMIRPSLQRQVKELEQLLFATVAPPVEAEDVS